MSILLWIFQLFVAAYCVMGAVWRFLNYEQAAKDIASINALSSSMWNALGLFEIVCALGLVLPGILKLKPSLTPIAATCLAVEMLLVTALHANFFGFEFRATNPALWTMMLSVVAAFVAYGRFALKPL